MNTKFTVDDKEYLVEDLSDDALVIYRAIETCNTLVDEKQRFLLCLEIAHSSTMEILKKQVLADKAGLLLDKE